MGQVCGRATGRTQESSTGALMLLKEPELVYFDGPGRAQLTRDAFKHGNVSFKDTRLTFADWPAVKNDPASAPARCFGSMPVVIHGDQLLAQSIATAQYAADLGINKSHARTAQQRSLDTMVLGAHADLQAAMYACLFGSDEAKAKGKENLPGKVQPLLGGLERMYTGNGPFLYGTTPSLGDLAVANAVDSPFPGLKVLGIDMGPYPKLEACVAAVSAGQSSIETPTSPVAEGEIELMYFAGPGRGELTRLALHAGSVAFKDTRIQQGPDWTAIKEDSASPPAKCFGSVPVLTHGAHMVAQSIALAQYAADLGINKGKPPTPYQRGLDMAICGAHADLQAAMYKCLFGTQDSKDQAKNELPEKVKPTLDGIERFYKADGPFLYSSAADGPTLGDLAVFDAVTSPFPGLVALGIDLDKYPKITKCVETIKTSSARPGLQAYLSSKK